MRRAERGAAAPSGAHLHHDSSRLNAAARRADALAWCQGRRWPARALLLAYLTYISFESLRDPEYWTIFSGITLGVHEAGHVMFSVFGEMMEVAGGSITQLVAPLAVAVLFLRQREYFGISVALAWLSMSLANLATYIGDARVQELPLVGLSGDPMYDWHYLLGRFGLLGDDVALARFTYFLAAVVLVGAIALGAWLCVAMHRAPAATAATPAE